MPSANAAARSADARLRLVFAPGFTTARSRGASVVRGYGLDAAAGRIAALGGTIAIRSAPGEGTVFTILLPDGPARSRVRRPAGRQRVALGEPVAALPAAPSWS
jgi:two-component system chemotaxis sensor kinase CheA